MKNPKSHLVDIINAATGLNRKANFDSEAFGMEVNKKDLTNMVIVQPKISKEQLAHDSFFGYFNNRFVFRLAYGKESKHIQVLERIALDRPYEYLQGPESGNATRAAVGGSRLLT